MIGRTHLLNFDEAARRAIEDERHSGPVSGAWGAVERLLASANPEKG